MSLPLLFSFFFFFNDTATTEIYTLSLHDALPILSSYASWLLSSQAGSDSCICARSEEHTSELQSRSDLVCRLLLEKKKNKNKHKHKKQTKKKKKKKKTKKNNT